MHPWSIVISTATENVAEEINMFDGTPMTKEEFLEGIQEAAQDLANPDGEFNAMIGEFTEVADEVRRFDPQMADKFVGVVTAIQDLGAYMKERSELMVASDKNTPEES